MDNPLEQPAPEEPIARVHAFARDLAWGAVNGEWDSRITIEQIGKRPEKWLARHAKQDATFNLNIQLKKKWSDKFVESSLLRSFGYFELDSESPSAHYVSYLLTQKAFSLLEGLPKPPKVFISYRQNESSAFASLIEARLTLADPNIGIFIDKVLEGGEEWERRIEQEVRRCDTFICVYGPDTPNSTMIPKEIDWAEESRSRIVPVLHNGFTRECEDYPEQFRTLQDIPVETESAEAYEFAILKLLNTLGYPTLQSPRPSVDRV